MIDYEKLKLAHELAAKYEPNNRLKLIFIYTNNNEIYYALDFEPGNSGEYYSFSCIEEVIDKLQSLTNPEPKYKTGNEILFLHHECIEKGVIHDINIYNNCYIYHVKSDVDGFQIGESLLFPTRQALIEHQIKHWSCLLNDEKSTHSDDALNESTYPEYICERCEKPVFGNNDCPCKFHIQYEGNIRGLSSCCSVHAGTPYECIKSDIQRNQSEVDVDRCQHESDGKNYVNKPPCQLFPAEVSCFVPELSYKLK